MEHIWCSVDSTTLRADMPFLAELGTKVVNYTEKTKSPKNRAFEELLLPLSTLATWWTALSTVR